VSTVSPITSVLAVVGVSRPPLPWRAG
jgi:hypothetical protein